MKKAAFNGTIRWNKPMRTWLVWCEICWEGPKGKWGQGYTSSTKAKGNAVGAVKRHIRQAHGVAAVIRTEQPILE